MADHEVRPTRTILGIDAAWTAGQPSGVALVSGRDGSWGVEAVAASYEDFEALSNGRQIASTAKGVDRQRRAAD